jgi:hypothetical protein
MQCCASLCVDASSCLHAMFTLTSVFTNTYGPRYPHGYHARDEAADEGLDRLLCWLTLHGADLTNPRGAAAAPTAKLLSSAGTTNVSANRAASGAHRAESRALESTSSAGAAQPEAHEISSVKTGGGILSSSHNDSDDVRLDRAATATVTSTDATAATAARSGDSPPSSKRRRVQAVPPSQTPPDHSDGTSTLKLPELPGYHFVAYVVP